MYILVTSFIVHHRVHDAWLESLRQNYLPVLLDRGYDRLTLTRLISDRPTEEFTYSLQVEIPDMEAYRAVNEGLMSAYGTQLQQRFGEGVLFCTSLLKRVELK